jgi:hypothetical protein
MTTSLASEFFFFVLNLFFFFWCIAPYMGYFAFGRRK